MVFSSPIFIFIFLPVTWLLCAVLPRNRSRNLLLAAAGLLFYAFGGPAFLPLFLLTVLVDYAAGLLLLRPVKHRKAVLTAAVLLNLLPLLVYKYTDFLIENLNALSSAGLPKTGLALPLAISFYTFQGISYVTDTYRDPEKGTKDFWDLLLFMCFFPQLTQGPILRYGDLAPQLEDRSCSPERTTAGIRRFITGHAKKVILAGAAGTVADRVFALNAAGAVDFRLAWLGGIGYMLQIYYDFSGYSDMACGLAAMFGFTIAENFNFPYAAVSIRDFWRRWHITLSSWFRDYVYIPLGGSREGKAKAYRNRMLVFLCTGIWHGANWTFVVWGVCHGILSNLEGAGIIPVDRLSRTKAGRVLCRIYTLLAVMLLFVIFRADTLGEGLRLIGSMFSFRALPGGAYECAKLLSGAACVLLAAGALLAGNIGFRLKEGLQSLEEKNTAVRIVGLLLSLILFAVSVFAMARGGFSSFIYSQF